MILRTSITLLLLSFIGFNQNDTTSNKKFHVGWGFSPFINFYESQGEIGDNQISCFLLNESQQGKSYNFIVHNEGHSFVAIQAHLKYNLINPSPTVNLSLLSPIEFGISQWLTRAKHGIVQQCEDSRFNQDIGYLHVSTPIYLNLNLGYGASENNGKYKGFGISTGIEIVNAPLFTASQSNSTILPELSKVWMAPALMIDFKFMDRKNNLFMIALKGSYGSTVKQTLPGGEEGDYTTKSHSISVIRYFNWQ